MGNKLFFYHIKNEYIDYLKKYQDHIWNNEDKLHLRPYIGVVIEINNFKYYAPLTSPKAKHIAMKERLDFIKIEYKGELKAAINLNNMIPVKDENIELVDIENEEEAYKALLHIERKVIRTKKKTIIDNAKSIYNKVVNYPEENEKLVSICYDFKRLEQKCEEYNSNKKEEAAITSAEVDNNI